MRVARSFASIRCRPTQRFPMKKFCSAMPTRRPDGLRKSRTRSSFAGSSKSAVDENGFVVEKRLPTIEDFQVNYRGWVKARPLNWTTRCLFHKDRRCASQWNRSRPPALGLRKRSSMQFPNHLTFARRTSMLSKPRSKEIHFQHPHLRPGRFMRARLLLRQTVEHRRDDATTVAVGFIPRINGPDAIASQSDA